MLVDHERVLMALKRHVAQKSHHGQRDLLAEIARLEVRHQVQEGLPEEALRLYGVIFQQEMLRPVPHDGRVRREEGHDSRPLGGDSYHEDKENDHGVNRAGDRGVPQPRGLRSIRSEVS